MGWNRFAAALVCAGVTLTQQASADALAPYRRAAVIDDISNKKPGLDLAMTVATMDKLASARTVSGRQIAIWRTHEKVGECSGETARDASLSCPRVSLLVSTMMDLEGGSKFRLFKTSGRLNWTMPDTAMPKEIVGAPFSTTVLACEPKPEGSKEEPGWRYVAYRLTISDFDHVTLEKVAPQPSFEHC